ncbi:hypothetical protein ON010_g5206 [Phytophthora cinnamomi]|nr:hypothetical protein ON010_g5206 [Phytophthora cinnamomi]
MDGKENDVAARRRRGEGCEAERPRGGRLAPVVGKVQASSVEEGRRSLRWRARWTGASTYPTTTAAATAEDDERSEDACTGVEPTDRGPGDFSSDHCYWCGRAGHYSRDCEVRREDMVAKAAPSPTTAKQQASRETGRLAGGSERHARSGERRDARQRGQRGKKVGTRAERRAIHELGMAPCKLHGRLCIRRRDGTLDGAEHRAGEAGGRREEVMKANMTTTVSGARVMTDEGAVLCALDRNQDRDAVEAGVVEWLVQVMLAQAKEVVDSDGESNCEDGAPDCTERSDVETAEVERQRLKRQKRLVHTEARRKRRTDRERPETGLMARGAISTVTSKRESNYDGELELIKLRVRGEGRRRARAKPKCVRQTLGCVHSTRAARGEVKTDGAKGELRRTVGCRSEPAGGAAVVKMVKGKAAVRTASAQGTREDYVGNWIGMIRRWLLRDRRRLMAARARHTDSAEPASRKAESGGSSSGGLTPNCVGGSLEVRGEVKRIKLDTGAQYSVAGGDCRELGKR